MVLLGIAAIVAIVARPLRLPHTVALVVVGLLIGGLAGPLGLEGGLAVTPEIVLLVLLPGLVFEAAYRLRLDRAPAVVRGAAPAGRARRPGLGGIVAVVLHLATGLPLDLAFLVGAMVSATDPAAVVATFKRLPVSRSLATLVDGESLLNDGTGLVLFAIAVRAVAEPVGPLDAVVAFACRVAASVAIGLAFGGSSRAPGRRGPTTTWSSSRSRSSLAYGTYLVADQFHFSGVHRDGHRGDRPRQLGPGRVLTRGRHGCDRHRLGVPGVSADGGRLPARRAGDPAGTRCWAAGPDRAGRSARCSSASDRRVRRWSGGASRVAPLPGFAGAVPGPWLHVLFWAGLRGAVAVAMALALPTDMPQRALLQDIVVRGRAVHAARPGDHDRRGSCARARPTAMRRRSVGTGQVGRD